MQMLLLAQILAFLSQTGSKTQGTYLCQSRVQHDTNQCSVTLKRLLLIKRCRHGGELVSWRTTRIQTFKIVYYQCKKRKVLWVFLVFCTGSCKSPKSKKVSGSHPTIRTSCCTSSKRPVLLDKKTSDLLRRMGLAFRGVVLVSSTVRCAAPPDEVLHSHFCGRPNRGKYFQLKHLVAEGRTYARTMLCLLRIYMPSVTRITFLRMKGPQVDEEAVEARYMFTDWT